MRRYTNINNVRFTLDGYKMNNNKFNVEYLAEQVEILAENTRSTYELLTNTHIKNNNVALYWLMHFINTEMQYNGFEGCYCTIAQIQSIEKQNPELITVIESVRDYVIEVRKELNITCK